MSIDILCLPAQRVHTTALVWFMKNVSIGKRILSLLSLVLILTPMLLLVAYASSDKYDFGYSFNGTSQTVRFDGTKSDLGESTASVAGVTVTVAQFGAGSCTISMENSKEITISTSRTISSTGTYSLTYTATLPSSGTMAVKLACYAQSTVQAIAGRFQP